MKQMIEIKRDSLTLSGMEHFPDNQVDVPAVVIVPALLGTKVEPHRLLRKISVLLETIGVASLRFDLAGSGESDGEFEDATITSQVLDTESAIDRLRTDPRVDPQRIGLLGISMGGIIAACAAGRRADQVERVALLSPWVSIAPTVERIVANRPKNRNMNYFDYNGNRFGLSFGLDVANWDIDGTAGQFKGKLLIVQGTGKGEVQWNDVATFHRNAYDGRGQIVAIDGANHMFDGYIWEQQVLEQVRGFWG